MKKTFIRVLSLLLVAVMLMAVLVSCVKKDEPEDTEKSVSTDLTTADILGFDVQDNDGKQFNVFVNNSYPITERDFYVENSTENNLTKAIYERNVACEEYLGITLNFVREAGAYNSDLPNTLNKQIQGQACEYDMVAMGLNTGIMGNYINIYSNVMEMDYINLEHEWWVQDMIDKSAINNQLYFLTGDACISTYSYIGCILANLAVADEWKVEEDFYQIVKDNKWTFDEMMRITKLVGADADGNGSMESKTGETYGWCMHNVLVRLMWSSCDMNLTVRQADGTYALVDSLDTRMTDWIEKLVAAYNDEHTDVVSEDAPAIKDFAEDRVLFMSTYLGTAEKMKSNNMDSPFAILPMPKYDNNQEDYIVANFASYNALFFPITVESDANKSAELSAMVAEFMGWQGKEVLVPEYYDVSMKYKNSDVNANIEMLDLIRDKLRVTPNESYTVICDAAGWMQLTDYTATKGFYANYASYWAQNAPEAANKIQSYVLQYYQ